MHTEGLGKAREGRKGEKKGGKGQEGEREGQHRVWELRLENIAVAPLVIMVDLILLAEEVELFPKALYNH